MNSIRTMCFVSVMATAMAMAMVMAMAMAMSEIKRYKIEQ